MRRSDIDSFAVKKICFVFNSWSIKSKKKKQKAKNNSCEHRNRSFCSVHFDFFRIQMFAHNIALRHECVHWHMAKFLHHLISKGIYCIYNPEDTVSFTTWKIYKYAMMISWLRCEQFGFAIVYKYHVCWWYV